MTGVTVDWVLETSARLLVEREAEFNALDGASGDGDMGSTLARGAAAVLRMLHDEAHRPAGDALERSARTFGAAAGGTSGALWSAALLAVAQRRHDEPAPSLAVLLDVAAREIAELGAASEGDKTMLDALLPAVEALAQTTMPLAGAVRAAAVAARAGAERTRGMVARRGRAAYSAERTASEPDAGALAVAVILEQIVAKWPMPTARPTT